MTDIVNKETRSSWMAGIGRKDTRPEMIVRRVLHSAGLRYVLNDRRLPGSPDIVLPKYGVCIFVHGCYWHRHSGCKLATTPATRPDFWQTKFDANQARDVRNVDELLELNWRVIVIWECGLKRADAASELDWLPGEVRTGELPRIVWPSAAFAAT